MISFTDSTAISRAIGFSVNENDHATAKWTSSPPFFSLWLPQRTQTLLCIFFSRIIPVDFIGFIALHSHEKNSTVISIVDFFLFLCFFPTCFRRYFALNGFFSWLLADTTTYKFFLFISVNGVKIVTSSGKHEREQKRTWVERTKCNGLMTHMFVISN